MKKLLAAVLGLAVGFTGTAGTARAQTLDEAMAAAYANNPTLTAARAGLRGTDEKVPQALAKWRPTVDVDISIGRSFTFSNTRTVDRTQARTPRGGSLTIKQPLFRGFRTVAEMRKALSDIRSARASLIGVEQTVLLSAATAYMNVVRDQAVLELNISNEQVLNRQLEATRDRFRVGEITRTDVSQAEARLAGSTADRIQAEGNLEASRAAYQNVIGAVPGNLTRPQAAGDLPVDREAAISSARELHPDVLSAIHDEESARSSVDAIVGELLPVLNLTGKMSRNFETAGNKSRVEERSVTANLEIPLYQSGSVHSRLRAAKQTAGQKRLLIDKARRDATEAAARTWESLQTDRARIESISAQIEAAEVALEGVEREAAVGSRTVLDVLDAEQELLDAKVSLVRAQRDETVAVFELKAATGQLTASRLGLPVTLYDADLHFEEVFDKWFGLGSSGEIGRTAGDGGK